MAPLDERRFSFESTSSLSSIGNEEDPFATRPPSIEEDDSQHIVASTKENLGLEMSSGSTSKQEKSDTPPVRPASNSSPSIFSSFRWREGSDSRSSTPSKEKTLQRTPTDVPSELTTPSEDPFADLRAPDDCISQDHDVPKPLPSFLPQRKKPKKRVSFSDASTASPAVPGSNPFDKSFGHVTPVAMPNFSRPRQALMQSSALRNVSRTPMENIDEQESEDEKDSKTSSSNSDSSQQKSSGDAYQGLPPRRKSSFMLPFARRRSSAVAPDMVDDSGVRRPSMAHVRPRTTGSISIPGRFRDPFNAFGGDSDALKMNRRASAAPRLERRPSSFQRMMSVVAEPNPIPQRYRSKSVSSLAFYISSLESATTSLPIFHDDVETQKEDIQEYLAGVERLQATKTRKPWQSKAFMATYHFLVIAVIYLLFVGKPFWSGIAVLYYQWLRSAGIAAYGFLIFMAWAALQAFAPLLCFFEQEVDSVESRDASETALIIPAYKAGKVLGETIEAALVIFKPEQIFIINNANAPQPPDNTADVCAKYGVNHAWVPIGSKIVAEFVGVALTKKYKYIMLIDDDVHLPANLPIVTHRLTGNTKCIGYTIKSTGENGAIGTTIQQCQDMEYKMSGLTRTFCGRYGSATFPHGAIILWEREVLQDLFNVHPGYVISEDWYFGHAARSCGYRIQFCSQVFVETETPPNLVQTGSSDRGGFGEMTVFKQRFKRWNYFYVYRCWEDTMYVLLSWRLGWREIITKIWVIVEVYDSVMAFLRPIVIVITAIAAWRLLLILSVVTISMYIVAFCIFNSVHLKRKGENISYKILPTFLGMKFMLLWVNSLSVYYGVYDYARYFSVRHPRVIESRAALEAAYQARLGTCLTPLDTKLGDGLPQVPAAEVQEDENITLAQRVKQALTSSEKDETGSPLSPVTDEDVDKMTMGEKIHRVLDSVSSSSASSASANLPLFSEKSPFATVV